MCMMSGEKQPAGKETAASARGEAAGCFARTHTHKYNKVYSLGAADAADCDADCAACCCTIAVTVDARHDELLMNEHIAVSQL